jgi:thymidylate synthase (FAD)
MKIVEPSVEYLWATPQAEKMIEIAGRTCYKSEPKIYPDCTWCKGSGKIENHISLYGLPQQKKIYLDCDGCSDRSAREFIQKIIKSGHHSVLEHASASFRIICDRGISHEIVRHRIASYSQESSRYCNYSKDKFGSEITVIRPTNIKKSNIYEIMSGEAENDLRSYNNWVMAMSHAERAYIRMLENGESPQNARSVLPTCLKTEIVMTTNFRSWRNFLKLRLDKAAHPDMIVVAKMVCRELKKIAPTVFEEFECEK